MSRDHLARSAAAIVRVAQSALFAEEQAMRRGVLQKLDPRTKIATHLILIALASFVRDWRPLALMLGFGIVVAFVSRLDLGELAFRVWLPVFVVAASIMLPSLFFVRGAERAAWLVILRAEVSATFAVLLVLTTPWTRLLAGMRALGVPAVVVAVIGMTYRYLFVLLATAQEMLEARASRTVGTLGWRRRAQMIGGAAGVLLGKTMALSNEIYSAMEARGFRGEFPLLDRLRFGRVDAAAVVAYLCCAAATALLIW